MPNVNEPAIDIISSILSSDESSEDDREIEENGKGEDAMDSDVFEVESIIASRLTDEGRKFLVQWKGWPEDQNSWEPEDNLRDSMDKLNDYLKLRSSWIAKMPKKSSYIPK